MNKAHIQWIPQLVIHVLTYQHDLVVTRSEYQVFFYYAKNQLPKLLYMSELPLQKTQNIRLLNFSTRNAINEQGCAGDLQHLAIDLFIKNTNRIISLEHLVFHVIECNGLGNGPTAPPHPLLGGIFSIGSQLLLQGLKAWNNIVRYCIIVPETDSNCAELEWRERGVRRGCRGGVGCLYLWQFLWWVQFTWQG